MEISNRVDPQVVTHDADANLATLCASWTDQAAAPANLDQLVKLEMQIQTISSAFLRGSDFNQQANTALTIIGNRITHLLSIKPPYPL